MGNAILRAIGGVVNVAGAVCTRCWVLSALREPRPYPSHHVVPLDMLQGGVHPKIVSERLGHSGVGITLDTYSHVLPGLQARAAAQLDRLLNTGLG